MNFLEAIRNSKNGDFSVDCNSIRLEQTSAQAPLIFDGPGYIRQAAEGRYEFKIYDPGKKPLQFMPTELGVGAGRVFGSDVYFSLKAVAHDGSVWTSDRVLPRSNWAHGKAIVTGDLREIRTVEDRPGGEFSCNVHFFQDIDVPLTEMTEYIDGPIRGMRRDRAVFSSMGMDFEIKKAEDEFVVSTNSKTPLPSSIEMRIQEALEFISGQSLVCRAVVTGMDAASHLELRSPRKIPTDVQLLPPISANTAASWTHNWQLFLQYFEYIIRNGTPMFWHHCSYHIRNAREASSNTLDARALGLSVAVEGLADLIEFSIPVEERGRRAAYVKAISDFSESLPDVSKLHIRLKGLLGMMSQIRVQDRLAELAAIGRVTPSYVKAWAKLRNRYAHPKRVDLKPSDRLAMQMLLDRIHQTETLMYQIVFHLIGYTGAFTDYGRHGKHAFPTGTYPLSIPDPIL